MPPTSPPPSIRWPIGDDLKRVTDWIATHCNHSLSPGRLSSYCTLSPSTSGAEFSSYPVLSQPFSNNLDAELFLLNRSWDMFQPIANERRFFEFVVSRQIPDGKNIWNVNEVPLRLSRMYVRRTYVRQLWNHSLSATYLINLLELLRTCYLSFCQNLGISLQTPLAKLSQALHIPFLLLLPIRKCDKLLPSQLWRSRGQ